VRKAKIIASSYREIRIERRSFDPIALLANGSQTTAATAGLYG